MANTQRQPDTAPLLHVNAGNLINTAITNDQKDQDLKDCLKGATSSQYNRPLTGSTDAYSLAGSFVKQPATVHQGLGRDYYTFQGLLPEIGYAWATSDHRLYLWNLNDSSDITTYDDQDQIICAVGLVKPAKGVFKEHVQYLLIVATILHVVVLQVVFEPRPDGKRTLVLLSSNSAASTDGQRINTIASTDDGRIFLCAKSGHIYDLHYKLPRRFVGPTAQLNKLTSGFLMSLMPTMIQDRWKPDYVHLAVDSERHMVYALTSSNRIDAFFLGPRNDQFLPLAHDLRDIERAARTMCRQAAVQPHPLDFRILSIHIVPRKESHAIHLVAVTERGFRLYFTHYKNVMRTYGAPADPNTWKPNTLELVHIRLPPHPKDLMPPPSPNANANAATVPNAPPSATITTPLTSLASPASQFASLPINFAHYRSGVLLTSHAEMDARSDKVYLSFPVIGGAATATPGATSTTNGTTSSLFPPSPAPYAVSVPYSETLMTLQTQGRVWAMAEAAPNDNGYPLNDSRALYSDPARKLLIYTDQGVFSFVKPRPVDTLYNLLRKSCDTRQTEATQRDLLQFIQLFGHTQTCAFAMSIICSSYASKSTEHEEIARRASQFLASFGGQPTATGATLPNSSNPLGQAVGPTGIKYSSRHDGIILYFARLLANLWRAQPFAFTSTSNLLEGAAKVQKDLFATRTKLKHLERFFDAHAHLITPLTHDALAMAAVQDQQQQQILVAEQTSLSDIHRLLCQAIEAIDFIDFVIDGKAKDILLRAREHQREELRQVTLETLLATPRGTQLKRDLVIATIDKFAASHMHAGYDMVTRTLRDQCPTFFGPKDVLYYQGVESLSCAHKAEAEYDRNQALEQSVVFLCDAADALSAENLAEICVDYRYQGYYVGVAKLALARASKLDANKQALAFRLDSRPAGDARAALYDACCACYHQIFQAIDEIDQLQQLSGDKQQQQPQSQQQQQQQQQQQAQNQHLQRRPDLVQDLKVARQQLLATALASDDQLFHYTLYDWFQANNKTADLLAVNATYILPFLKQQLHPRDAYDILWRYHRMREQYYEAALYLELLATRFPDMDIGKRIEFFALGIVNARSCSTSYIEENPDVKLLLRRLEKGLEKARAVVNL